MKKLIFFAVWAISFFIFSCNKNKDEIVQRNNEPSADTRETNSWVAEKTEIMISKETALELAKTSPDKNAYDQISKMIASNSNLKFKYVSVSYVARDKKPTAPKPTGPKPIRFCAECIIDSDGILHCVPIDCPKKPVLQA